MSGLKKKENRTFKGQPSIFTLREIQTSYICQITHSFIKSSAIKVLVYFKCFQYVRERAVYW